MRPTRESYIRTKAFAENGFESRGRVSMKASTPGPTSVSLSRPSSRPIRLGDIDLEAIEQLAEDCRDVVKLPASLVAAMVKKIRELDAEAETTKKRAMELAVRLYEWCGDELQEVIVRRRRVPLVGAWYQAHVRWCSSRGAWCYAVTGDEVEPLLADDVRRVREQEQRRRRRAMHWHRVEYERPEMRVSAIVIRRST